ARFAAGDAPGGCARALEPERRIAVREHPIGADDAAAAAPASGAAAVLADGELLQLDRVLHLVDLRRDVAEGAVGEVDHRALAIRPFERPPAAGGRLYHDPLAAPVDPGKTGDHRVAVVGGDRLFRHGL